MPIWVIAIAGAVMLSVLGGMATKINNDAFDRGAAACREANQKATDELNGKIKKLQVALETERVTNKRDREEKLSELLASNTGDACVPDDAYRQRLNAILQRGEQ